MDHHTIGHHFNAWDSKAYRVESHDHTGYWVVEIGNPENRKSISERAIGRTYHHDNMCPCHTGIEVVDGLTGDELALLDLFNACAFDLHRVECQKRNERSPAWLIMSEEARAEVQARFVEHFNANTDWDETLDEKGIRGFLNSTTIAEGPTPLGALVTRWREAEAMAKREREAGNPGAYFCA